VAARIKRDSGAGRVDSGGRTSRSGRSSLPLSVSVTPSGTAVFGELAMADSGPESAPTELHFGVTLRRAREQRGLSLHEVAEQTRISVRWLDALEDARTEQLPAPVFVIGYLRSYARALGLSGDEVVDRYRAWQQRDSLPPAAEPLAAGASSLAQRRALILTLVLLLVGIAALVGFFLRARH
jgi:transcriptional regulator with XRE-family HTH domain